MCGNFRSVPARSHRVESCVPLSGRPISYFWSIPNPIGTTSSSTRKMERETTISMGTVVSCDHDFRTPFYCEENVWRLLRHKLTAENDGRNTPPTFYAVYISNPQKRVVMQCQRASNDLTISWDYHVVVISTQESAALVYDVDSTLLPYPMPLQDYLSHSFPALPDCFAELRPTFRLIPGDIFVDSFGSDRSHMYNTTTQRWNAPPPSYDCIVAKQLPQENTHLFYMDFAGDTPSQLSTEARGQLLNLRELQSFFSRSQGTPA